MITPLFEQNGLRLSLAFDVALPEELRRDSEFQAMEEKLSGLAEVEFHELDGSFTHFSLPTERWLEFARSILPADQAEFHARLIEVAAEHPDSRLGEGLEINFHQNVFDEPDRYWRFIFAQGNFTDYIFNRLHWVMAPRYKMVAPMPLHVDIETANTCNMNCPMCYRDMMKEVGQMDFDLFTKIVDECAERGVYSIRLSWRGESLTHPRIKDMIAYAAKRVKNVSTLTNAFYIDEDIIDCIVKNGLSYLAVSFDGIRENYNLIRHPARFEDSYEKLQQLRDKKQQAGASRPQVRLCTIWPAIREAPQDYYETMKPVSDYMVSNPYINFKGEMKIKPDFICQYPWERLVVAFNGKTQCCTGWNATDIILGNAKDKTLEEMWHSSKMQELRKMHAGGRRLEVASCAECRHGSKGDPNVDIREIVERRF